MAMRCQASPLVDSSGLLVHGFAVTWRGTRRLIRGHAAHESTHMRLPAGTLEARLLATHPARVAPAGAPTDPAAPFGESGQDQNGSGKENPRGAMHGEWAVLVHLAGLR